MGLAEIETPTNASLPLPSPPPSKSMAFSKRCAKSGGGDRKEVNMLRKYVAREKIHPKSWVRRRGEKGVAY